MPDPERLRTVGYAYRHIDGNLEDLLCEAADEIERLRANLHLIAQVHQQEWINGYGAVCMDCDQHWPCPTYQLIDSKEPDDA